MERASTLSLTRQGRGILRICDTGVFHFRSGSALYHRVLRRAAHRFTPSGVPSFAAIPDSHLTVEVLQQPDIFPGEESFCPLFLADDLSLEHCISLSRRRPFTNFTAIRSPLSRSTTSLNARKILTSCADNPRAPAAIAEASCPILIRRATALKSHLRLRRNSALPAYT